MDDIKTLEHQKVAWTPSQEVIERSRLMAFMRQVGVSTWDELYAYSIADVEKFTAEVLKFLDIKFDPPYQKLLDTTEGVEFPKWFQRAGDTASAGLNITEMCLDRWQTDEVRDRPAVIWEAEEGHSRTFSYAELLTAVDDCARLLTQLKIGKGDAVGIHLPMTVETVAALLGINRIGAIAVPVFSGYGIDAITSRMEAVEAKALFTAYGTTRRGKPVDMLTVASRAVANVPSITSVIVVTPGSDEPAPQLLCATGLLSSAADEIERLEQEVFAGRTVRCWSAQRQMNFFARLQGQSALLEKTSAEDPLIILYTSGTTGKPKGIAHTHASFPIKAAQDMAFGTDVGAGTRICWYSDLGWMMGPWLIYGALINGATVCLYDGAPDYPHPDRMWEFCSKHHIEVLGISPTLIRALSSARSADTPVRMSAKHEPTASDAQEEPPPKGWSVGSADTPVRMSAMHEPTPSDVQEYPPRRGWSVGSADTPVRMSAKHEPTANDLQEYPPPRGWSRKGRLPHFDGEVTQFITFRLTDSLPGSVLERLKLELRAGDAEAASDRFRQSVDDHLDKGAGQCILREPAVAEIVKATILHESGKSCDLKAWVIMPNHVHLLLRMLPGHDLAGLMKRIKGVSARRINQLLGTRGPVWQADYFDRYIRDEEHFYNVYRYIENNPVSAHLVFDRTEWPFSSAFAASGDADKSVRAPIELSSLRIFGSTGEPWNPDPWWWLFEKVGDGKLPIINYSGGTEISGGILMGNPLLPIKPCSFPAPCPGMDVEILDEDGDAVGPNQVGELVIKQPWVGMARGFWHEPERYLETYWRRFENIWVHGDWAMRDEDGQYFILGRSDDTLKVAGKRVGPAEVESILVSHPYVTEAAVIGVPDEIKGTAMVAFCVAASSDSSRVEPAELKQLVAREMGKPLAPSHIHFVSALPKTRNAKVMRRVIRAAYLGQDPGDVSALEQPQVVDEIASIREK